MSQYRIMGMCSAPVDADGKAVMRKGEGFCLHYALCNWLARVGGYTDLTITCQKCKLKAGAFYLKCGWMSATEKKAKCADGDVMRLSLQGSSWREKAEQYLGKAKCVELEAITVHDTLGASVVQGKFKTFTAARDIGEEDGDACPLCLDDLKGTIGEQWK